MSIGVAQVLEKATTREALISRLAEALARSRSAGGEVAALE